MTERGFAKIGTAKKKIDDKKAMISFFMIDINNKTYALLQKVVANLKELVPAFSSPYYFELVLMSDIFSESGNI